ncbi:MAG: ABC transporter permease [Hyphomicrobiales bacterium]
MSGLDRLGWRVERADASPARRALSIAVALVLAVLLSALLFRAAGASPLAAFAALLKGSLGSWRSATETLVSATPLIFTGLATAVAFRARVWNIGAEGQVFAGAMFAYWCQHGLAGAPAAIQIPVVILGGLAGGGLYAGIAAVLKTRFNVDEVISTVMLNYIIVYALSLLLLQGPWSEPGAFFEQTAKMDEASLLPLLFGKSRLHAGFLLALAAAAAVQILMTRTPVGYEIRAAGSNLRALEVQGTRPARVILMVMIISGALAGLAGVAQVYGVHYRLKAGALSGYGYTGIIVAILGQLNAWGVVAAAVAFGALVTGATFMQVKTGVPSALIYAVEAILLLCYLAGWAASSLRLRRVTHAR